MPTIDSNLVSLFIQVPLVGFFFLFMRWFLERQDKKEKELLTLYTDREKALTTAYLEQLRVQREQHEKENAAVVGRYEAVTSKVMEVMSSQGESMRGLNKTVEQFTNLRNIEEQIRGLNKDNEKAK